MPKLDMITRVVITVDELVIHAHLLTDDLLKRNFFKGNYVYLTFLCKVWFDEFDSYRQIQKKQKKKNNKKVFSIE